MTGADGRTRIGGLLTTTVELVVTHEAYPGQLVRREAESGDEVLIELLQGASLTVVAPRLDGQLAAGYVCEVDRASLFPMPFVSARFDEEGRASFAPLRPGAYVVSVSKDGAWQITMTTEEKTDAEGRPAISRQSSINHESDAVLLKKAIVLKEGAHEVLDLSGIGGARIAGRLFLEGDPRPWRIRLLAGDDEVASTSPDGEGRFQFLKVAPGTYRVAAHRHGMGEVAADCEVAAGDEAVSVRLQVPQGEVSGLVTGPDGRPLAGVTIHAVETARLDRLRRELRHIDDLAGFGSTVESGEDGTFRFGGIPAGGYTLFCAKDGFLARQELDLEQGQRRRVDIHLDATHLHRVTLRLTDERGDPVRGHLLVRGAKGGFLTAVALSLDEAAADSFTLHLEDGRYLFDLFAEGRAPLRGRAVDVRGPTALAIRLERGVAATLVFARAEGPVAGAALEVRDHRGLRLPRDVLPFQVLLDPRPWRTDARGRVVLPHVLPGRYTVHRDDKEIGDFRVGRTPIQARIHLK